MKLLLIREVARWLRCSQSTAYGLVASGALRHVRLGVGKGGIRIPVDAVQEFLAKRQTGAAEPKPSPPPRKPAKLKHLTLG